MKLAIGIFLFSLSLILAFFYHFNHFYEFSLIGLFLIISHFLEEPLFGKKETLVTYVSFLGFGLFVDLLSQFFGLWYYSYQNLWEYLLLYFVIYPLGGVVMLQSYILAKQKFGILRPKKIPRLFFWLFSLSTLIFLICVAISFSSIELPQWGLLFMVAFILFVGSIITNLSEFLYQRSYLRDFLEVPIKTFLVTLLVTYSNAFIHEIPNVFSRQWIYTVKTNSFLDIFLFGVPLIVWVGWIALSIGPVGFYYLSHGYFERNNRLKVTGNFD
ncbi:MAG: hypothetical protein HYT09_03880 [Candidatus Levybacteria bacterium]|nr:hypothetical protein [Candidatus Levybacteria bacterium]